jgi:FMN phosphatase YigB (HAD superfamily)
MKRLIIFDLDGTLAESKSPLDAEMSTLLRDLLGVAKVAVISGGDWPQFEKQASPTFPMTNGLRICPYFQRVEPSSFATPETGRRFIRKTSQRSKERRSSVPSRRLLKQQVSRRRRRGERQLKTGAAR